MASLGIREADSCTHTRPTVESCMSHIYSQNEGGGVGTCRLICIGSSVYCQGCTGTHCEELSRHLAPHLLVVSFKRLLVSPQHDRTCMYKMCM